jgi:hypothetical protein
VAGLGTTVGAKSATDSGNVIVGAAIGAVVVVMAAIGGFTLYQRKQMRRSKKHAFSSGNKGAMVDAQMLYLGPATGYATPGLKSKTSTKSPSKRHLDEEESEDEKPAPKASGFGGGPSGGGSRSKLTVTKGPSSRSTGSRV